MEAENIFATLRQNGQLKAILDRNKVKREELLMLEFLKQ